METNAKQSIPQTRSILDPPFISPQPKQSRLKNFLFWFFIVEHLVILLLIGSLVFFYVKASAAAPFEEIQSKAAIFQPQPLEKVLSDTTKKYENNLPRNKTSWKNLESTFSLTEDEASSIISGFAEGSKIVVILNPDNHVTLWMKFKDFNQPVMLDGVFTYDSGNKLHILTRATQIGSIPIPFTNTSAFNGILENFLNNLTYENGENLGMQIKNITTGNHVLTVTLFSKTSEDVDRFLEVK